MMMEGEAGSGGTTKGNSFDEDVFGMGSKREVSAREVDGTHVAFDGDVFGIDEDVGEFGFGLRGQAGIEGGLMG